MSANLGRAVFVLDADDGPLERGIQRAESTIRGFGDRSGRLLRTGLAISFGTPAFFAGILAANQALSLLAQGVIQFNSTLDQSVDVFTKFRGSAEEAKARVQELFDIAKTTPFDFEGVLRGASVLEALGGQWLANATNIRLFGDAAAATVNVTGDLSSSLERTTFWVARLYSGLQSGAPLGEALLRLQELGLVTDTFRAQIELAREAGANPDELFDQFLNQLRRFEGLMDLQQKNFQTQISTTRDNFLQLAAIAGRPIFDKFVEQLTVVNARLGNVDTRAFAEGLGRDVSEAIDAAGRWLADPANMDAIRAAASEVAGFAREVKDFFGATAASIGPVLEGVATLVRGLDAISGGRAAQIIALGVAFATFRRQATLARDLVFGSANLFDVRRDERGRRLTGADTREADRSTTERASAGLTRQLERDQRAVDQAELRLSQVRERAADRAVADQERTALRVAKAREKAISDQLRDIARSEKALATAEGKVSSAEQREAEAARRVVTARDQGANREAQIAAAGLQRQTDILTAAVQRQTLAWERHQIAVANVGAAHRALGLEQGRQTAAQTKLTATELQIQSRGGLDAVMREAAVEEQSLRNIKRLRQEVARTTYNVQASASANPIDQINKQNEAQNKLNAAIRVGHKFSDDNIGLLKRQAEAVREVEQSGTSVARAEAEVIRREEAAAQSRKRAVQERVEGQRKVEAAELSTQQRILAVRQDNDSKIAALDREAIKRGDAVAEARARASTASVDLVSARVRPVTVAAQAGSTTALLGASAAATQQQIGLQQRLASSNLLVARSQSQATVQDIRSAIEARRLAAATASVDAAKIKLIGTQSKLDGALTTGVSRFAAFSQVLSIAAVATLALNAATETFTGVSLPQAIASLLKYGNVFEETNRKIKVGIQATNEGDTDALKVQIEEQRTLFNRAVADRDKAEAALNQPFSPKNAGTIIGDPFAYSKANLQVIEAKARYEELTEQYKRATAALLQYTDAQYLEIRAEEERRSRGEGTLVGPLPVIPNRPGVDAESAESVKEQKRKLQEALSLNLPLEIKERLTVDATQYLSEGRNAMRAYFAGFTEETTAQFGALRGLMEDGLKNARPGGKLTTPDLIDLSGLDKFLAQAISQISETGKVTDDLLETIRLKGGPASTEMLRLLHAYEGLKVATDAVDTATERYKRTQQGLADSTTRVATATRMLGNEMDRARDAANERQAADQRAIRGLQRALDEVQQANQAAQRGLQDNVRRISADLERLRDAAAAAAAADQLLIEQQQAVVSKAQEDATRHAAAFDAVLSGQVDRFLQQQGEVDELTLRILARYEAEIGAARRLKDATSERADGLGRNQRRELLAFDEAIAVARERGDRGEVARLTRLRQQAEERGSRQIALERSRAGVAQDEFDQRAKAIGKEKDAVADADQATITAAERQLTLLQTRAAESAKLREAEIAAVEAQLAIAQNAIEARQRADADHERSLQEQIAIQQRAAEDAKEEDDRALAALKARQDILKAGMTAGLGLATLLNKAAESAFDAAKDALVVQQDIVKQIERENQLLGDQDLAWQKIITTLKEANLPVGLSTSQFVPSPSRPDKEPDLKPTYRRDFPDGTPWPSGSPPSGYRVVASTDGDGKPLNVLQWLGDPSTPMTGTPLPPPSQTRTAPPPAPPSAQRTPSGPGGLNDGADAALRFVPNAPAARFASVSGGARSGAVVQGAGGGGGIVYNHNGPLAETLVVREEADIDRIAALLSAKQARAFAGVFERGTSRRSA